MAVEFRSTYGDKDIIEMFNRAKTKVMNDPQCQQVRQTPDFKCNLQQGKTLILPLDYYTTVILIDIALQQTDETSK